MLKPDLFAAPERDTELSTLGDSLHVLERHVDFAAPAAGVDDAAPRPGRQRASPAARSGRSRCTGAAPGDRPVQWRVMACHGM
jgi:hypothetical protein